LRNYCTKNSCILFSMAFHTSFTEEINITLKTVSGFQEMAIGKKASRASCSARRRSTKWKGVSEILYGPVFVDFDVAHSPMYSNFAILDPHVLCSTILVVSKLAESLGLRLHTLVFPPSTLNLLKLTAIKLFLQQRPSPTIELLHYCTLHLTKSKGTQILQPYHLT